MLLTPDDQLISCHDVPANWVPGANGAQYCSECNSLHPDEFVAALVNDELIEGWVWKDNAPLLCILDSGVFYFRHLWDVSEAWLREATPVILESTGLLFYFNREQPTYYVPKVGFMMGRRMGRLSLDIALPFMKCAIDRYDRIYHQDKI
jgi:hypothetical protein